MITLYLGKYTIDDINILERALNAGLYSVTNNCTGDCKHCVSKKVCGDFNRALYRIDSVRNTLAK